MKNINPNPFTTRPEIEGTFGVVDVDPLDRDRGRHGDARERRQCLRCRRRHRLHAAGGRAPSQWSGRRCARHHQRCAHRQDRGDLRPGSGAGQGHDRALPRPRPRHGARHRPARGLRARHVRHLDDAAARLRHHAARRRAGAGDLLRQPRPSPGRARARHHRHRRGAVPQALADIGGGLSPGRQGAGDRARCSPTRRWPRPTRACCARRKAPAATACARSRRRARSGRRVSSPRRSTASAARRR